jgi:uncharacterized protein
MSDNTPTPPPNPVIWWEIQVPDLDKGQAFYRAVFGWTFEPFGEEFVIAKTPDGTMVGGLVSSEGDASPSGRHVRIYFAVQDLEATLRAVEANGGEVVDTRTLISEEYGWSATFADPTGIKLGLVTDQPAAS